MQSVRQQCIKQMKGNKTINLGKTYSSRFPSLSGRILAFHHVYATLDSNSPRHSHAPQSSIFLYFSVKNNKRKCILKQNYIKTVLIHLFFCMFVRQLIMSDIANEY